jgi:uncharacterized membrane protein YbaN (DUF454 family)
MPDHLVRPPSSGNPECPADAVKAVLVGREAQRQLTGVRRALLVGVGAASLATGVVGMVVPVLPTTCFLLLAAWCFARSSPRLYGWMFHNALFGRYLRDYRDGRGIPRAVKVGSLSLMWLTIGASVVFAVSALWLRVLLLAIAAAVTIHVASQRNSAALSRE